MSVLTHTAPALRWEDPPSCRRTGAASPRVNWPLIAAALRANPNQWAIVCVAAERASAARTANRIKVGRIQSLYPVGAYEAKARTVGGECRVYARYIGGER